MTLEEYFRSQTFQFDGALMPFPDHAVRCNVSPSRVTFYIHPQGRNGDTCDFEVTGNLLTPNPDVLRYINVNINGRVMCFIENTVLLYDALVRLAGLTGRPTCVVSETAGGYCIYPDGHVTLRDRMIINLAHTTNA